MPSVRIERGSAKLPETERVAIIASYGPDDSVSRSLPTLTAEFERNGYTVIIVRASENDRPLRWPDAPSTNPTIVRRSNIGYDFGSWAVGLALFPAIRTKPFVILANDSLVGPFASLTPSSRASRPARPMCGVRPTRPNSSHTFRASSWATDPGS
ncbi:hypothetical protein [Cryobacterium breve]|uniref:hypothetical protein n=1 Tax=Cryobacterium breve TaxID=1259258 RepID=UPI00248CFB6E|nr:hypothetical protein [Cryobacterium breve]